MSKNTSRIIAITIAGILIITAAVIARKHVTALRLAAQNNTSAQEASPEQIEAEKELVKLHDAARAAPNDKQKQWDLANFYMKNRLPDKAADQLANILQLDKTDIQARIKLADMCLAMEQYPLAETYYRAVVKSDPKNLLAWQGVTASLIKQRRMLEAVNAGKTTLDLDKKDSNSLLLHSTALLHYAQQFPDPLSHGYELKIAEMELAGLAKSMPESGDVFYTYGRVEQAMMHRDASIANLERAHQLMPKNGDATRMLAISYRAMLRDDKALKLLQEDAAIEPDNPTTNDMLGLVLLDSAEPGAQQKAVDAFKRAFKVNPDDPRVCEHLGTALEKIQDLQGARLAYERATQLNPFRAYGFQKLALVYTRLGETKLAKQAAEIGRKMTFNAQQLATIIQLSTTHPRDVGLHLILADRYRDMNMAGAARDEYFTVLRLDPKNKRVPAQFMRETAPGSKQNQ